MSVSFTAKQESEFTGCANKVQGTGRNRANISACQGTVIILNFARIRRNAAVRLG
jgi:hypothetical protein